MKKFVSLLSLLLLFGAAKLSAQIVSAGGKSITLNKYDVAYLREFNNAQIDSALSQVSLKYNDTADMIIALVEKNRTDNPQKDFVLADVVVRKKGEPLR